MILFIALSVVISPVIVGGYILWSRWQLNKHHFRGF